MNELEYRAMKEIVHFTKKQRGENPFFSSVHCMGKVIIFDNKFYTKHDQNKYTNADQKIESMIWSFQVQDKLGDTMEKYLFDKNEPFTEKSVLQIGIQLLD